MIVTLPLGVLKSGDLAFAEPLAKARQDAIRDLRMGTLAKTCWSLRTRQDCECSRSIAGAELVTKASSPRTVFAARAAATTA